jgi:tripeptide aminopeptidase
MKPGAGERRRLHASFESLCRIPSETGDERAVADWLIRELGAMGLAVEEDDAGAVVGSNAGNLLARIPARGGNRRRSILLCAHMDTVPLTAPVEPVFVNDGWENAGEGILGADNKAALAALVETARILCAAGDGLDVGVELLFTIAEETGLRGATAFDAGRLHSDLGYVFDHASPLGEIIVAAPTLTKFGAEIRGRAAHAGLHPELGVSAIAAAAQAIVAMPQGRLDPETTANIGTIRGGTATNVVSERCWIEAEVRGIDQGRVDAVLTESIDAIQDAVDQASCDVDITVQRLIGGYRVRPHELSLELAERALRAIGHEPRPIISGGGSDANALRSAGFQCTNLANGTERAHEPGERVSSAALEDGLALICALLEAAGATEDDGRAGGGVEVGGIDS